MNGYTYPPHQPSPQHQQHQQHHQSQAQSQAQQQQHQLSHSPTVPQSAGGGGINPAMLQGGTAGGNGVGGMSQAQLIARQQMMSGMGGGGMHGMGSMAGIGGIGGMSTMGGGMNGMGNMGLGSAMPNGAAMNMAAAAAMNNRMSSMGGMNIPGNASAMGGMSSMVAGMPGMNSMNMNNMNMDLFKSNMGGAGGNNMNMDNAMTINPAMLGSSSNPNHGAASAGGGGGSGMSSQDLQKMVAARQAALSIGGMGNMAGLNNMNNLAGMGGMGGAMGAIHGMNGMNMNMNLGMNMMSGNAQQQAMMQQYLAQQQQQSQQNQAHSPHSATHTPASATSGGAGGNPYPPFPTAQQGQSQTQSQQQMQAAQNLTANINSMPPPPVRPSTAMSTSSQHGMGMGIGRPPSTIHQQQQQQRAAAAALHNQQQQQQQSISHGSISRPQTASGFRPSSSAGLEAPPRTPHTPSSSSMQMANAQQSQVLSSVAGPGGAMQSISAPVQNQSQGGHVRELSQTPSRPQTAASNHGASQGGQPGMGGSMNGKYSLGMGGMGVGMGVGGMNNSMMAGMNMNMNMGTMGGLMGTGGGGMMPPPTIPSRQGSLGPSSSSSGNQNTMQVQHPQLQHQQQHSHLHQQHQHQQMTGHAQQQQQQGMMSGAHGHGHGHVSPPGSAGLTRTSSIGEGLGGMVGNVMGGPGTGVGVDDPMGNLGTMGGMNSMNPTSGLGVGVGVGVGSGMSNAGMSTGGGPVGMGMAGLGAATSGATPGMGAAGTGMAGGVGGMSHQMQQHMQEMQHRKAITIAEYNKQLAARQQQQQQQHQQQQHAQQHHQLQQHPAQGQQGLQPGHVVGQQQPQPGHIQNAAGIGGPVIGPLSGAAPAIPSAGAAPDSQNLGVNMAQTHHQALGPMPGPASGMNMGIMLGAGAAGTPPRSSVSAQGRGSMPPPPTGSAVAGAMSLGGIPSISGTSAGAGIAPPTTAGSGISSTVSTHATSINGAIPPTQAPSATAASSSSSTTVSGVGVANTTTQQNAALAASLPPLPADVNLSPNTTRMSVVPISESAKKIPPLSPEEIEKVAEWLKTDREYEQRFRQMVVRAKTELAIGPAGSQRPRWWERDLNSAAAAAAAQAQAQMRRTGKMEKFDLMYPQTQAREAATLSARRKQRRREGLKVPGKLKPVDAEKGEQLVPIRLEFDVEHHKYRDTFVWNLNDPIVTPEAFAQSLIDDYGLSTSYHSMITKSIQEQLSDYKAHTATLADVSNDIELSSGGEPKAQPVRGLLEDEGEETKWWTEWRAKLRKRDGAVRTKVLLKEVAEEVAKAEKSRKRKRGQGNKEKEKEKEKESASVQPSTAAPAPASVPASTPAPEAIKEEEKQPIVTANATTAETDVKDVKDENANGDANPNANTSTDVEMRDAEEDDVHEELRILIKLDITVGEMKLDDQFEWDIENQDPTPEQFAEVYCIDLGLAGEFKTAIAHSIREQVAMYQKSLFLVGHPSDGSVIQDDDLRMSFLDSVISAARSVDQTQAHQPIINYLSDGELDRLDKEREKEANKRRKRNTRGRRGVTLPDREPIRTHRTPAIGFPEIDPSMLAIAAAAAAPTSRRAAAAAASVTIANMVASENGTALLPPVTTTPAAPALPVSKIPKPRGSFKAPSYPSSLLKPRANVTSPTPSTVVDTASFEPPIEGDAPLPPSAPATPTVPQSKAAQGPMTAKRQRELEKEAKEREFADGQRANMINGVWHCSNCGCPDSVAIGRRKGPLGDKSQCGACGKFWHRHRRPRPVEYHTDPEYHLNLRMESERAKASAKKRGGAAALRALNLQKDHDQAATPASDTNEPSSPPPAPAPKTEMWVEIKSPRKSAHASPAPPDGLDLDRPLSPASDVSSSASEKPLAHSAGRANGNGTANASKAASAAATPVKASSELPAQAEASDSKRNSAPPNSNKDARASETRSTSVPAQDQSSDQAGQPPRIVRPQWLEDAMAEMRSRYSDDNFDTILRKQGNGNPPEWRVKCFDCPGKLYTPGPGETLSNFEVHLKNRQHRAKVQMRLAGAANS